MDKNSSLKEDFNDIHVKKIALAMLYLGEGSKGVRRQVRLGNSDSFVIELFMSLMRECYNADESKFRCAVQCRADQDEQKLKIFWSKVTKVPLTQFYNSRIDKRTIEIPTLKLDYKGVCNIDYFSSEVFLELMQIPKIIFKGPVA